MNLSTNFAGLKLNNPIIAASSGLTDSIKSIKSLANAGVGAIVLKSIFEEEILMEMEQIKQQMTGRPYVYPETLDYLDEEPHVDLISSYIELIEKAKKEVKIPIIASVNCVSNQKWTYIAKEIESAGADAIELNLFSLPSDLEKPAGEIEQMYTDLVNEVCSQVKIPIILKISPYFTSLGQMVNKFSKLPIKGIVLFNRYYSPDIDINNLALATSFVLSSPSEIAQPLRWIALLSDSVKTDFAASTGVHTGADVIKMLLAGASVVQVASTIYNNGEGVIKEMTDFLSNWMKENEYKSIKDFRGKLSLKGSNNKAPWARVQFMREFRNFIK